MSLHSSGQKLKLSQQQKLTPQFVQYLQILQIPYQRLSKFLQKELESNPAMEIDPNVVDQEVIIPNTNIDDIEKMANKEDDFNDDETYYNHYNSKRESNFLQNAISYETTPYENLDNQIRQLNLTEKEKKIAQAIIGNLDTDGYLRRDIQIIVDDLEIKSGIQVKEENVLHVLKKIQHLEPTGIGARNLAECLILQVQKLHDWDLKNITIQLLTNHANLLTNNNYTEIIKKYSIEEENIKQIFKMLSTLDPKPGNKLLSIKENLNKVIKPDFSVHTDGDNFEIIVHSISIKEIRINPSYLNILENKQKSVDKEMLSFVKEKVERVIELQKAMTQRTRIFKDVMQKIVQHQKAFFKTGAKEYLQPYLIKDLAHDLKINTSIISKIISKKHVNTEYGIFPLKMFFFERSFNQEGEEIHVQKIKKILADIIEKEDKSNPITDIQLTEYLKQQGFKIARRTVSKYREQLHILKSSHRKKNIK